MTVWEFTLQHGEPPFERDPEELKRILITQLYENSVLQYGPDSEQAFAWSKFLSPIDDIRKGNPSTRRLQANNLTLRLKGLIRKGPRSRAAQMSVVPGAAGWRLV